MSLYYCINDVLDQTDRLKGTENRFQTLIDVSPDIPECGGHSEDAFTLASSPKMLDLTQNESAYQLALLLEDVPLYNINMELVLDQALTERHRNSMLDRALQQAFGKQPLPNTLQADQNADDGFSGDLQHPMLEHLDKRELCRIYIDFLNALERDHDNYGFERNILGKHIDEFLKRFDGFITNHGGKVKAQILLAFGSRQDHDPGKPLETHVENGQKTARRMNIDEPREMIWAWLEAENYQIRRCRDLDRIMLVEGLPKIPNWVRTDLFCCLEKEAMKQVFAETLLQADPKLSLLEQAKQLKRAVEINAQGHVDETLQQLLSQTLGQNSGYAGAAAKFVDLADKRAIEAKKSGLH